MGDKQGMFENRLVWLPELPELDPALGLIGERVFPGAIRPEVGLGVMAHCKFGGGVPQLLLELVRLRWPKGGVPMVYCRAGGEN